MKIFSIKDGQEIVNLQIKDLVMLNRIFRGRLKIVNDMYNKYEKVIVSDIEKGEETFFTINDKEQLNFIKSIDWIVDYSEVISWPVDKIDEKLTEILLEENMLYDSKKGKDSSVKIAVLDYMIDDYLAIKENKVEQKQMDIKVIYKK